MNVIYASRKFQGEGAIRCLLDMNIVYSSSTADISSDQMECGGAGAKDISMSRSHRYISEQEPIVSSPHQSPCYDN